MSPLIVRPIESPAIVRGIPNSVRIMSMSEPEHYASECAICGAARCPDCGVKCFCDDLTPELTRLIHVQMGQGQTFHGATQTILNVFRDIVANAD